MAPRSGYENVLTKTRGRAICLDTFRPPEKPPTKSSGARNENRLVDVKDVGDRKPHAGAERSRGGRAGWRRGLLEARPQRSQVGHASIIEGSAAIEQRTNTRRKLRLSDRFLKQLDTFFQPALMNDGISRVTGHVKHGQAGPHRLRAPAQLAAVD